MIELEDVAYVRSGTADLETAVRFAVDVVGLEEIAREDGVAYLRADHRHHCLAFVEGEPGVLSTGFAVHDPAALNPTETDLAAAGCWVRRGDAKGAAHRRVHDYLEFDDPWGNRVELVSGQVTIPRPVRFGRAAGITEFGHICLDAPDVREAYAFWSSLFNIRISDWIGDRAALMRFDPVHHKLAVFQGDRPGLCHMNFQVASLDDVMRSWHVLERAGVEIELGPGRHPQSTAVFLYFKGPEGLTYEYSWGVRRIEDDDRWRPRYFDPAEPDAVDLWGGPTSKPTTQYQVRGRTGR
jgi:2,3-dihydroxy-p-cumate/2,3-dihydroxybenzoate 3,4-dioxygenase